MTAATELYFKIRGAQLNGVAVALGDEDRVGTGKVRLRFAQRAARKTDVSLPNGLLAVNEHDGHGAGPRNFQY